MAFEISITSLSRYFTLMLKEIASDDHKAGDLDMISTETHKDIGANHVDTKY
jgi:hypothetical protein